MLLMPTLVHMQRELALYTYRNLDRSISAYFMDKDIDPVFKGTLVKNTRSQPIMIAVFSGFCWSSNLSSSFRIGSNIDCYAAAESWCKKGPPPPQLLTSSALQPVFPQKEPAPPPAPSADVVRW